MTPTHNGTPYRVIYTADGDLWARDVLANPPKAPKQKRSRAKRLYKQNFEVNAETAVMVYRTGLQQTARHYGITYSAVSGRIRRLEKALGFRIFPGYGYSLLTSMGRQFIQWHTEAA